MGIFKKFRKRHRCESIFEIIIAITVIGVGTSAVTALTTSAMRASGLSKEFIIVNNLAAEGLEAVSNIRESNWIEFPGYETDCWNVISSVEDASECGKSSNKIGGNTTAAAYFVAELDAETYYGWTLTKENRALTDDLTNATQDGNYALYMDDGIYTTTGATDTPFYRMITIQYYDDNSTIDPSDDIAAKPTDGVYMTVTSTVKWKDHIGAVHSVAKSMRLFNAISS